jgi:hypothetical protein
MLRAHARAFSLSVTPGNRRRNSITVEDGAERGRHRLSDDEYRPNHGGEHHGLQA